MRLQSSQSNCGPAAAYNAACALGLALSLEACEKACGTTATDGTPIKNLKAGLAKLGLKLQGEIKESKDDVALLRLDRALAQGHAVLLVVDGDSHWAAAVGALGDRSLIADSAENEMVLSLSAGELAQRWMTPGMRKGFYGVAVSS